MIRLLLILQKVKSSLSNEKLAKKKRKESLYYGYIPEILKTWYQKHGNLRCECKMSVCGISPFCLLVKRRADGGVWKDSVSLFQTASKPQCQHSDLRAQGCRHIATNEVNDLRWLNQPWKWCRAISQHWHSLHSAVHYLYFASRYS